jgi:periplasmic protein CpxP/Spy
MTKVTTLSLATVAVAMRLVLSPALRAQDTPAAPQRPGVMDHGGMMGGDMGAMMKMMGQMSQMMDQCSRMMQSMQDRQAPKTADQPPK